MKTRANNSRTLSWLPALIGMAVLFYSSSLPGEEIHLPPFPFSDKAVHFAAYGVLGALIAWRKGLRTRFAGAPAALRIGPAETETRGNRDGNRDWIGAAVGMAYGVGDEIHQIFVPLRMFAFSDMAADCLGVAAGMWAYRSITGRPS